MCSKYFGMYKCRAVLSVYNKLLATVTPGYVSYAEIREIIMAEISSLSSGVLTKPSCRATIFENLLIFSVRS